MMPCHFGRSDSPLFGVYHEPVTQSRSMAVLLCYPIGHEYMTAHSTFRDLANALAKDGFPVLRFDYWGIGDSSGDDQDVTLGMWEESVDLAATELIDMSGTAQLAVIGLRFGAVLAARYARRAVVNDLLLWDPVVRGADYLAGLRALHNARLTAKRGTPVRAAQATETSVEIAGYYYPDPLREAVDAIDLSQESTCSNEAVHPPRRTALVCSQDLAAYEILENQLPGHVHRQVIEDSAPWDIPSRRGDPLRPRAIPAWIREWLKQGTR